MDNGSSASEHWRIGLVAPHVWQVQIRRTFEGLNSTERDLAYSIISCLHSRHAGITPELAADAARLLLAAAAGPRLGGASRPTRRDARPRQNSWKVAFDTMRDVARHRPRDPGQNQSEDTAAGPHTPRDQLLGLLPHASFSYVVFRVITPLTLQACSRVGYSLLFCQDPNGCNVLSPDEYKSYAIKLRVQIEKLMDVDDDDLMNLFWRDRTYTLLDLSRRRSRVHNAVLPKTRLPDSRVFLDLEPETGSRLNRSQRSLDLSRRQRLYDPHLSNPGADGAKLTRRWEEIDRILRSEFIYPEVVRLDRLINTGYWVIKQPPQPVQTRDVLVVGMCPGDVTTCSSSVLLKTCWFDLIMCLGRLLQHNGLKRSEFRWIEGDDIGRVRTNALLVEHLPDVLTQIDERHRDTHRYHLLKASGWFPSYIDPGLYYEPLPLSRPMISRRAGSGRLESLRAWFKAAWNAQQEFVGWKQEFYANYDGLISSTVSQPLFSEQRIQSERFRFVYVMLFLPANLAGEEPSPAHLRQQFRFFVAPFHGPLGAHTTWVPGGVDSQAWYTAGRRSTDLTLSPNDRPFSTPGLAGRLIDNWLEDFVGEIQHA